MSDHHPFDEDLSRALNRPVATDPSAVLDAIEGRKQQRHRHRRALQGLAAGAVIAMLAVGLPLALHSGHGGRRTTVATQHPHMTVQAPASEPPEAGVVGDMSTTTTLDAGAGAHTPTTVRHAPTTVPPTTSTTISPPPVTCAAPQPATPAGYNAKISAVDAQHVWMFGQDPAVGANGGIPRIVVLRTRDGGRTWDMVICTDPRSREAGDLVFADSTHGWLVGWGGLLLATTDGGSTWHEQALPPYPDPQPDPIGGSAYDLFTITATDALHVWAAGNCAQVATTDGGAHWKVQQDCHAGYAAATGISFGDNLHGVMAGGQSDGYRVTHDGGATWVTHQMPAGANGYGVQLVDASHGWMVGSNTILHTDDGGDTWQRQGPPTTNDALLRVDFVDLEHGWAVGGQPTQDGEGPAVIMATVDGGQTWTRQSAGSATYRYDVAFTDATHGWAVGTGLLKTSDGGATWVSG